MDQKRRDFFRNLGSKSVGLAAGAVAPTMLYIDSLKSEIKTVSQELNQKLARSTDELISQIQRLNSRLDRTTLTMTYQQAQIFLIFFLLLVSFAIDAGMTATWILV